MTAATTPIMIFHPITPAFAAGPAVRGSDFLAELCASTIALYPAGEPPLPWTGYLVQVGEAFVGTCAFKGVPVHGQVEIAYFTFPDFEGRGIATRMAQHLLEVAAASGVRSLRAQTLPERNASTRILEKLGFTWVGPVRHPDDGDVWEWSRTNPASDEPARRRR